LFTAEQLEQIKYVVVILLMVIVVIVVIEVTASQLNITQRSLKTKIVKGITYEFTVLYKSSFLYFNYKIQFTFAGPVCNGG
jgi:hypothetical protein